MAARHLTRNVVFGPLTWVNIPRRSTGEDPELLEAIVYKEDNLSYDAIVAVYIDRKKPSLR
jgi:hypothetical protein